MGLAADGWKYRFKLRTPSTQVGGVISGYVVELDHNCLPSPILDSNHAWKALSDGRDIRFTTDEAGDNELPFHIKRFVQDAVEGNRRAQIMLNKGSLTDVVHNDYYIWCGKADATAYGVNDPYGQYATYPSNRIRNWLMDEDPSGAPPQILDATSNVGHGTTLGSMTVGDLVDGLVGRAINFDNSDDAVAVGALGTHASWSVIWVARWASTDNGAHNILTNDKGGWNDDLLIGIDPEDLGGSQTQRWSAVHQNASPTGRTNVNDVGGANAAQWYTCMLTSDGIDLRLYVDGVLVDTTSRTEDALDWGNNDTWIGAQLGVARLWNGDIQEIIFFDETIGLDYFETYENNIRSTSTFVTVIESVEIDLVPPTITGHSPAKSSTGAPIDTNIYFELDDDNSGVDEDTITVTVEGGAAITNGVFQSGYAGTISADGDGFNVTINPDADFDPVQVVNVVVDCDDNSGNSMVQDVYSFTIASAVAAMMKKTTPGVEFGVRMGIR